MKVKALKTREELYRDVTWRVETISRREGGFRCELEVEGGKTYSCHRITLHSDIPLDWERSYRWDELQVYALWVGGVQVARPEKRAPRKPRPVNLRLIGNDTEKGEA